MDMDKLMEFLQKEVPDNAEDLKNSINSTLEIIECTRAALTSKYVSIAKNFFKGGNSDEIIRNFENAEKQLENMQNKLSDFLINDLETNLDSSKDILIEENDTEDIAEDEEEEVEEREGKIDYKKYLVDNTKSYPLSSDFENTTPDSFSFKGEIHKIKTYKEMWLKLCKILYEKDENTFKDIATRHQIRGRTKPYIVYESDKVAQNITTPLQFLNTKIILEGTTSTTQKIKIMIKMLDIYKISPSSVKVYLKSDRHPKHGQEPIGIYKDKNYDYKAEIALNTNNNENDKNIDCNFDIPIGKRAYGYFQSYFKNTSISYDIQNFLDKNWCKSVFNISFPLLKEYDETKDIKEQTIPEGKTGAYYAQNPKLHINNKLYIIYMQWNEKMHRSKLEKWIIEHPISDSVQDINSKMNVYVIPKNKAKICKKCGKKTLTDNLLLTYYKGDANFEKDFYIRRCKNCDLIFMSEGTYNMYSTSSDIRDPNVNFIFD